MRALILPLLLAAAAAAAAQPPLTASLAAEQADGLARPHDAAFSPDGTLIYLTDMANSRIVVLETMSLALVGRFGEGELAYPHDAEFDRQGRLLVADTGNGRIAIYRVERGAGSLVGELGGLEAPEGVAALPDGAVVATNTRSGELSLFRDGREVRRVGSYGSDDGQFVRPHDVDAGPDGLLYVVDSGNSRIQVFDAELRHRATAGAELALNEPKYLSFDGDDLWLADEYNHRILLLDREFKLRAVLGSGRRGRSASEYHKPEAVMARSPWLWVIDTHNDRVLRVDAGAAGR